MNCLSVKTNSECTVESRKSGCYCMYPMIQRELEILNFEDWIFSIFIALIEINFSLLARLLKKLIKLFII